MNWFDRLMRKPKDAIPNPRDNKRKQDEFEQAQRNVLHTLQFFVFMLAILILAAVTHAAV